MNNDIEEKKILRIISPILSQPQLITASKTSENDLRDQFLRCFYDEIANNRNPYDFRQIMQYASRNFMTWLKVEKKIDQRLIDDILAEILDSIEYLEGESLKDGQRDVGEIAKIIPLFPTKK